MYVPATVEPELLGQRIVEAGAVLSPGGGAVTGWAALTWRGARWFPGHTVTGEALPVQLITWDDLRPQPGFVVTHERLSPYEVDVVDGLPVTEPVRTTFFLMRYAAGLRQAVAIADMAAYDDLVSVDELVAYAGHHPGWIGVPQARKALALADENVWSPMETSTRLVWELEAELPRLLCNRPVFDRAGHHVATPDLLDLESGLAIEYDGVVHLTAGHRRRDRDRVEMLRAVGIETLTVLAGDVTDRDRLAQRMRRAWSRAARDARGERRWTIEPPGWWTLTTSVAARRALSAAQRDRLLTYRRSA